MIAVTDIPVSVTVAVGEAPVPPQPHLPHTGFDALVFIVAAILTGCGLLLSKWVQR